MNFTEQDGSNRRPFNADKRPRQRFHTTKGTGTYERATYDPTQKQEWVRPSRPRFNPNGGEERPRFNQNYSRPRFNNGEERPRYNEDRPRYSSEERPRFNGGEDRPRFNAEARPRFNANSEMRPRTPRTGYGQQPEGQFGRKPAFTKQRQKSANPNAKYSAKKRMVYEEKYEDPTKPIRLNKYLANAGICSRREADDFIQAGVITVNGVVVSELGAKVLPTDLVKFHDQPVRRERKVYVLLNKPKNCVTTTDDPQERHTVTQIVQHACTERIYPVGRLDRNTTGVLLLTNDGDLAAKLTHPKYGKKKIYAATLDKDLSIEAYNEIMAGITLDDEVIIPDALAFPKEDDRKHIGIQIHSGQNRVVRRIFEKIGYKVIALDRVSFAGLTKKNVPRGKYRFLTQEEVNMLQMGAFE